MMPEDPLAGRTSGGLNVFNFPSLKKTRLTIILVIEKYQSKIFVKASTIAPNPDFATDYMPLLLILAAIRLLALDGTRLSFTEVWLPVSLSENPTWRTPPPPALIMEAGPLVLLSS
jgi:hypothetical protein